MIPRHLVTPKEPIEQPERPAAPSALGMPWRDDNDDAQEGETPWLMSYLDFMAVLVTLFVFLYASEKARNAPEPATEAVTIVAEATPAAEETEPSETETADNSEEDAQEAETSETTVEEPDSTAEPPPVQTAALAANEPSPAAEVVVTTNEAADADGLRQRRSRITEATLNTAVVQTTGVASQASPAVQTDKPDPLLLLGKLADRVVVKQDAQKLSMEINDTVLFGAASVELTANGRALLDELKPVLIQHPGQITVEGHADDRPISTAQFPSNWELSTARASIVTRYLLGQGVTAERISPLGRANTQPRASNATAEGRAQNRRVAIVLHTQG